MARTRSSRLGGFFSVRLDGPYFSAMIRFIRSCPCSSGGCAYNFLFFFLLFSYSVGNCISFSHVEVIRSGSAIFNFIF